MLYEERRARFIEETYEKDSVRKAAASVFNSLAPFERKWDADICTVSKEDASAAMESALGVRSVGKYSCIRVFRDYIAWCVRNDIPGATLDAIDIKPEPVGKIKTRTVRSPLHLQQFLNAVFLPEEEQTIDNAFRCMYWLAYGGLPDTEIENVQTSDVDFSNLIVRTGNYEIPIYREALPAFHNCKELDTFVILHSRYTGAVQRVPGTQLLRGVRSSASLKYYTIEGARKISAAHKEGKTDIRLSYSNAYLSGIFYRLYERELAGMELNFSAVAQEVMEASGNQMGGEYAR